jgi:hypothetical protein
MQNRKTINNYLGNRGLSTLDDPQGLVTQLGFLVEDEKHFMQMINKCEPQFRRDMYESLRPHLRFAVRPLDVLIAELGMQAQIEQLPTVDNDGKFRAFRIPEIKTQLEDLVGEAVCRWHLVLTCRKCTLENVFHGGRKADAIQAAREAGWTYNEIAAKDVDGKTISFEVCPKCPASRN